MLIKFTLIRRHHPLRHYRLFEANQELHQSQHRRRILLLLYHHHMQIQHSTKQVAILCIQLILSGMPEMVFGKILIMTHR